MEMRTQQSLVGFIASDPQLSTTRNGQTRFFARIGQEHRRQEDDGTWTDLETTFHDMTLYRRPAAIAYAMFKKGDRFVAEGRVREYEREIDGLQVQAEEFIAYRIGHDATRHRYAVDRTPRSGASRTGRSAAGTDGAEQDGAGADGAGPEAGDPGDPDAAAGNRGRTGRARTGRQLAAISPNGTAEHTGSEPIGL